jgi:hypothetical protein
VAKREFSGKVKFLFPYTSPWPWADLKSVSQKKLVLNYDLIMTNFDTQKLNFDTPRFSRNPRFKISARGQVTTGGYFSKLEYFYKFGIKSYLRIMTNFDIKFFFWFDKQFAQNSRKKIITPTKNNRHTKMQRKKSTCISSHTNERKKVKVIIFYLAGMWNFIYNP